MAGHRPITLALSLLVFSCDRGRDEIFFRSPEIAEAFSPTPSVSVHEPNAWNLVWKNRARQLFFKREALPSYQDSSLVMVSFIPGSIAEYELQRSEKVLMLNPAEPEHMGAALVDIENSDQLEYLARLAHEPGQFSCGQMEMLDLGLPLVTDESVYPPAFQPQLRLNAVAELSAEADKHKIAATVKTLEDLATRYHTKASGLSTPGVVQDLFEEAAGGEIEGIEYELVTHQQTSQKSLVVRIPGEVEEPRVIMGAHLDSINASTSHSFAPGADDDATGVATLVEVVRIIAAQGLKFQRPIEFHAYAAEEVGLIGSGEIAKSYATTGVKVAAMMQLDMTAYGADGDQDTIFLVATDTSAHLRRHFKSLFGNYFADAFVEKELSAGTSDHKSWTNRGFATVFPFEDPENYNHKLHTSNDTIAYLEERLNLDFSLSERFTNLALVYLAHFAGYTGAQAEYEKNLAAVDTLAEADLSLAVIDDSGETVKFAVGAAETVSSVQMCALEESVCRDEELVLTLLGKKSARNIFFYDVAQTLTSGEIWQISALDAAGSLLGKRVVKLESR